MVSKPQITVLMTVYNGQAFLRESIESILRQTYADFEFLIINDGSTDGTGEIIRSYHDARIVPIHTEHTGRTNAVNLGIVEAKGKYIAFLDADDVSESNRLAVQYGAMCENRNLHLVGSFCTYINSQGNCLDRLFLPTLSAYRLWRLQFQNNFPTSSVMMDKEAAISAGMFPELVVAHDYALFSKMAHYHNTAIIPLFLCNYRVSDHVRLTNSNYDVMIREASEISNQLLMSCNPNLNQDLCSQMRPLYWKLEKNNVALAGLNRISATLEGFHIKFGISDDDRAWLTRNLAAHCLYSVIRNCEGSLQERIESAVGLIRKSPLSAATSLNNFFKLAARKLMKRNPRLFSYSTMFLND